MRILSFGALCFALVVVSLVAQQAPKVWDDQALSNWATPLAGLNAAPTHLPERDYYRFTVENLRTYPVYFPGREPEGYWEMLQHVGPKPLIEPGRLKTEAEWIEAGRRVFQELDQIPLRTLDERFVLAARTREAYDAARTKPLPDGTIFGARWVPTGKGVALSFANCAVCHSAYLRDGTFVPGAPAFAGEFTISPAGLATAVHMANRVAPAGVPLRMGDEPFGMWLYRESSVPWRKDDVHDQLKGFTSEDFRTHSAAGRGGAPLRWNGSLFFPAKAPDLIGLKDRKYLDATATHLHRGIGDLMRYAALVSYAEAVDFGPYHFLPAEGARLQARVPDEALYALALYIYSLKGPENPNRFDERAQAGEKIFTREGCRTCHPPPLYTNNRVTLAEGFQEPADTPTRLDTMPISVGTDSGLALRTRKGTGYYKIPSLRGVWYRGHYLHDGSISSLEEMFDPDRIRETHVPGGWSPPGVKTRAIKGHEFGLRISPLERQQLVAFLRTL